MTLIEFYLCRVYGGEHMNIFEKIYHLYYDLIDFYVSKKRKDSFQPSIFNHMGDTFIDSSCSSLAEFDNNLM
jgi:hypothetical protein